MATPRTGRPKGIDFAYSDKQWRRLEEIVESAGGAVARDKFKAQRAAFEKVVGGWRERLPLWNGFTFGRAFLWGGRTDDETYKRIESAACELHAALVELGFPSRFAGNLLSWVDLPATQEAFLTTLEHIRAKAAMKTKRGRKRSFYARERFLIDLASEWRGLGLEITMGDFSPFVAFAALASEGVVNFRDENAARTAILHTIWKWAGSPADRTKRRADRVKLRAARGAKTRSKET